MNRVEGLTPYALAAGEGEATWFLQNRMTLKATAASTGGAFGLVESLIAPGSSPPLHVHHAEDESFYVLEGRVRFVCGDAEMLAGPGSFVFAPRDVPHTFIVEGETPARMLTLLTPGGGERMFVEGGRAPEGPGLPPPSAPDIPRLRALVERYDNELLGPPLQPRA